MNTQLKKTRISQTLELFASNQHIIQKATGFTDVEYNSLLFDTAMIFLEDMYPPKTAYEEYWMNHANSKDFWHWFISEWRMKEKRLLKDYELSDIQLTKKAYLYRIKRLPFDPFFERAFNHNYLKR